MSHQTELATRIEQGIYCYGMYPALVLLQELEESGNFESCSRLLTAMKKVAELTNWPLPLTTDPENMLMTQIQQKVVLADRKLLDDSLSYFIYELRKVVMDERAYEAA
jgi:hypothetical protein